MRESEKEIEKETERDRERETEREREGERERERGERERVKQFALFTTCSVHTGKMSASFTHVNFHSF